MSDLNEDDPEVETETAEDRQQRIYREEDELAKRFVAEFGGEYNTTGTRYRVIIYAETMRQIFEYTRFLRDTAIGETTVVDEDP